MEADALCEEVRTGAFDLAIACKAVEESLGLVMKSLAGEMPVLVDVDDPDVESRLYTGGGLRSFARRFRHPRRVRALQDLRNAAVTLPTVVSNPWLQRRYGGVLVPHVRVDSGTGPAPRSAPPVAAFVGTTAPHKGINDLRTGIAMARDLGHDYRLVVTDEPPPDSHSWESWVGLVAFDSGLSLVRQADVIVLPSRRDPSAIGQLPVKLIDAMIFGRAVAVSDIEPLPWAVGDAGLTFPPQRPQAIAQVLDQFADPETRARFGDAARNLALARYTVEAVAPDFERACQEAINNWPRGAAG